mgnify:CR=1 FL=1
MTKPRTILIIDDSALTRNALSEALIARGFTALTADNGKAGLDLIQKGAPDVVLMDVVMPVMDGWETCRQIRAAANLQSVPIIIMTHKNTHGDLLRAFEVGANEFMEKPIDVDELVREIELLIQRRLDGTAEHR